MSPIPAGSARWSGSARAAKAATGADGCYTDMLMTAPLFENYASGGKPINPATGRPWTFPEFQAAVEAIADAVRTGVPGPYAANGVARGQRWFAAGGASAKTLTNHVDAAHAEIWLRDRTLAASQWPSAADWKLDVDMVVNAEAEGRVVMVETKLWETASAALVDRWRAFTLGSFLLGTEGRSTWFLFTPARTFAGMTAAHPWDDVPSAHRSGPTAVRGQWRLRPLVHLGLRRRQPWRDGRERLAAGRRLAEPPGSGPDRHDLTGGADGLHLDPRLTPVTADASRPPRVSPRSRDGYASCRGQTRRNRAEAELALPRV